MGFTPLEELMMGTRSGDLDPALPGFLARKEGVEITEVETWLNTRSGLLGVSERSSDMRELLEAAREGDAGAELAVAMFCYRVREYNAAWRCSTALTPFSLAVALEKTLQRCARICAQMDWCGLRLDTARNTAA
jgi:acetate kinase